jgi:hypothetical protein
MAQALASSFGEPVRHITMQHSQYAQLGFAGSNDLANMFQYKQDFNLEFCSARSVEGTRALHPELMSSGSGWRRTPHAFRVTTEWREASS